MEESNLKQPAKLIIIAGSAGSLTILFELLPLLEIQPGYSLLIVVHRKSDSDSTLFEILKLKTNNPIIEIEDKQSLTEGMIYLAPADYHLLIENRNLFCLDFSEKVNFSRPSIDVTFESAARIFKKDTIGILLSGANEDGSQGLLTLKQYGGYTIVQAPHTAQVSVMPDAAIRLNAFDKIMTPAEILDFLNTVQEKLG